MISLLGSSIIKRIMVCASLRVIGSITSCSSVLLSIIGFNLFEVAASFGAKFVMAPKDLKYSDDLITSSCT